MIVGFVAILTGHFLLSQAGLSQTTPDGFTVAGRVVNSVTGTGIPGVSVYLTSPSNRYDAATGPTGEFRLNGVNAGGYGAAFLKSGFYEVTPRSQNFVGVLRVGPGLDSEHVSREMAPEATIRGRVLDADGKPAPNVRVDPIPSTGTFGVTGEDGSFVLTEIPPESYLLVAVPGDRPVEQADGTRTKIVTTYYPSGSDSSQAAKVNVRAGDDLSGYEFHLQKLAVYRVSGVVLDQSGNPAPNIRLTLVRNGAFASSGGPIAFWGPGTVFNLAGPRLNRVEAQAATDDAGKFEFPAVISGEWAVIAETGGIPGHPIGYGVAKTTVGRRDVEGLNVQIAPAFNWSATFDFGETAEPKTNRRGFVMVFDDGGLPQMHRGRLQSDGSDRFEQLQPGKYRIAITTPESGYYPSAVLLGTTDVTGQVVELSAASAPLRIVFKPTAGAVHGKVEQGNGATVALIPQSFANGGADMIRLATCESDGTFKIENVPPGSYNALAIEGTENLPSLDVLRVLLPTASSVHVDEGTTASVDLKIQG